MIGDHTIIGALTFVPADTIIPERKVAVGNPVKIIKDASEEMIAWKSEGTRIYQGLPADCYKSLEPCEPLRTIPDDLKIQDPGYSPWKSR